MTYKFQEFVEPLVDAVVVSISPYYTIGKTTSVVCVTFLSLGKFYAITLNGFLNTDNWSDEDVILWVNNELVKYEITTW